MLAALLPHSQGCGLAISLLIVARPFAHLAAVDVLVLVRVGLLHIASILARRRGLRELPLLHPDLGRHHGLGSVLDVLPRFACLSELRVVDALLVPESALAAAHELHVRHSLRDLAHLAHRADHGHLTLILQRVLVVSRAHRCP